MSSRFRGDRRKSRGAGKPGVAPAPVVSNAVIDGSGNFVIDGSGNQVVP